MDFKELAQKRYSVRKFESTPIEKDKVVSILETARIAPTAANYQPQRILVLDQPDKLGKLKNCTPYHFNAPLAIIVCYDQQRVWVNKLDGHNSGDIDASIVGTHLMMAATDLGIGSVWVMAFDPVALRRELKIPADLIPVAIFPMGYPTKDSKPSSSHTDRLKLEETTFFNTFSE